MKTDPAAIGVHPERGVSAGTPDRRGFLAMGAAGGAGAGGAGGRGLGGAGPSTAAPRGPRPRDWEALRAKISSHKLIRPTRRGYDAARELFDPRFDTKTPAGIAYCGTPQDVSACVNFARTFRMPICARSGGHSYGGWSSVSNGLIVDVTLMNSFAVGSGTVRVGAGTYLIDLYEHLASRGLAIPGGSCPTVGIAGLALAVPRPPGVVGASPPPPRGAPAPPARSARTSAPAGNPPPPPPRKPPAPRGGRRAGGAGCTRATPSTTPQPTLAYPTPPPTI